MKIQRILIIVLAITAVVSLAMRSEHLTVKPLSGKNITVVEAPQQSEAMEHEDFIAEEYRSVLPEGTNYAMEGKIEASSFQESFVPRKAIDGKVNGPSYWEGQKDTYPNLLTLDMQEIKTVHAIRLCLNPESLWGKRTQEITVQISDDGENYIDFIAKELYEFTPDKNNEVILEFEKIQARFIRLIFDSNTGAGGGQLAEFEVYGE